MGNHAFFEEYFKNITLNCNKIKKYVDLLLNP